MDEVPPLSSTHPQLPPTTEENRLNWLRLLRSRRVGASTFYRLMSEHGSAEQALLALPDVAAAAGVQDYTVFDEAAARSELRAGHRAGAQLVALGEAGYPTMLATLPDPPPLLWVTGQMHCAQTPMIAVVGARNASTLGMRFAQRLCADLGAEGFTVISGLARGIDTAAHTAAQPTGTVAVMAGGIDIIYPRENTDLARQIEQTGLRLSEMPPGVQPRASHFPRRNRLISGAASAIVVVEAAAKSGSLITARTALDQGREVMVVPGHPFDGRSAGGNMLIRDGATLIRSAQDVIEALGPGLLPPDTPPTPPRADIPKPPKTTAPARSAPDLRATARLHRAILDRLTTAPLPEDQLTRDLRANVRDLAPILTDLELTGKISRAVGGLISRRE